VGSVIASRYERRRAQKKSFQAMGISAGVLPMVLFAMSAYFAK